EASLPHEPPVRYPLWHVESRPLPPATPPKRSVPALSGRPHSPARSPTVSTPRWFGPEYLQLWGREAFSGSAAVQKENGTGRGWEDPANAAVRRWFRPC